jgi:hypothetical protein
LDPDSISDNLTVNRVIELKSLRFMRNNIRHTNPIDKKLHDIEVEVRNKG